MQGGLFVVKAHFTLRPPPVPLEESATEKLVTRIAWTSNLPAGSHVVSVNKDSYTQFELDIANVPPLPEEEDMPPLDSLGYRVNFFFSAYKSGPEYWQVAGKAWSKERDHFIGPGSTVKHAVADLVAPGDSDEQKVRKIYAAIGALENTDYTRRHSAAEDKAEGLKQIATTDDILKRKRGNSNQLTDLFVAMVRAAGLKAYLANIANRSDYLFDPAYLNIDQVNDFIAIVPLAGKDVYLDPGEPFCEFKHLAWKHTDAGGIRQTEGGTQLITTPLEPAASSKRLRLADLKLDDKGHVEGSVTLTYTGDPALVWRQFAARGDAAGLDAALRESTQSLLPGGMQVRVTDIENLSDSDKPFKVIYAVEGTVAASAGKRLVLPADIFSVKPRFTPATRELPIDLKYAVVEQDAVRYTLPATLVPEALPKPVKEQMKNAAAFSASSKTTEAGSVTSITSYRNYSNVNALYAAADYPGLRALFSVIHASDAEQLVLVRASSPAAGSQ